MLIGNLMKKNIMLIITLSLFLLLLQTNFSFSASTSSNLSIANLSKGINISYLHANNTTYIFSNLNISINFSLPKSAISTSPSPSNTNSVNTQCNTEISYSPIFTNSSINRNNLNQSLANISTGSQTLFTSPSYNATSNVYNYSFPFIPQNSGHYFVQASCLTEDMNYSYNSTARTYSLNNITSINTSAFGLRSFTVIETAQNKSQYFQPLFNKTVTIQPNAIIINKTGYGGIIFQFVSINSSSTKNETVHIMVSNALAPHLNGFNYTNSFIYSFNSSTLQNLSIYFKSTFLSSGIVQVDILSGNAWHPIAFNYTGSDFLTMPLVQGIIGIFIKAPAALLNLTITLNKTSKIPPINISNITATPPPRVSNVTNISITNISNTTNISTTTPITPTPTIASNVTNITTTSHKIPQKNNNLIFAVIVIIIIAGIVLYYYYTKKGQGKKKSNPQNVNINIS